MAYEANRDDRDYETARADANNANTIRNAADVAIASKNPYAMAAGAAVKGLDAVSGGKASEALGKGFTKINQVAPGGKQVQNLSNDLSESGLGDKIGQAAAMKNQMDVQNAGGGQGSLPSSNVQNTPQVSTSTNADNPADKNNNNDNDNDSSDKNSKGLGGFVVSTVVKVALMAFLPIFFVILILFIITVSYTHLTLPTKA